MNLIQSIVKQNETRFKVVIDGSNVISGGARAGGSDGHRLISAIELYESKGYTVLPRLKRGTYGWMYHNDGKKSQGYAAIQRIVREKRKDGVDILFEDDDLYLINLALRENAWLVTNDTFENYWSNGEEIQRERELYPDFSWSELDKYTWGTESDADGRVRPNEDWRVDGPNFLHPRLQQAPGMDLKDENSDIRLLLADFARLLNKIEISAENHPNQELDYVKELRRHIGYQNVRLAKMIEIIPKPQIPSNKDELSLKTVDILKQYCDLLGLKKSGLKSEIIDRIIVEQSALVDPNSDNIEDVIEEDSKQIEEIIGFSKSQFISALLKCKKNSHEKTSFASLYGIMIKKQPKYDLKRYGVKPGWFLEECEDIIDIEIQKKNNVKSYWI